VAGFDLCTVELELHLHVVESLKFKVPLGRVVSLAKEYREYADECMGWAKSAKTDHERDIFLQMAAAWNHAALIASGAFPASTAWTKPPQNKDDNSTV
jgi:hypothetical protein